MCGGWSKTHSNKQITSADVVETLTPISVKPDLTERLIRPLTRLSAPDEQNAAQQERFGGAIRSAVPPQRIC